MEHTNKKITLITAVLVAALCVRVIYLFIISKYPNFRIYYAGLDAELYHLLAKRVASGDLLLGKDVYYYSPFYAYLLGALYAIFNPGTWAPRVMNIGFGVATVYFVYLYSSLYMQSKKAGYIAALCAALYGPFLVFDTSPMKTSSGLFFMAVSIYLQGRSFNSRNKSIWFVTGLFTGLALINFGHFSIFVILMCILLLLDFKGYFLSGDNREKFSYKNRLFFIKLLMTGLLLTVIPFTIRNYIVSGDKVLTACTSGIHLFIGNHKGAWGGYNRIQEIRPNPAGHYFDACALAREVTGRDLKASEVSAFWKEQAVQYIKANPYDFIKLCLERIFLSIHPYEIDNNENYQYLVGLSPYLSVFIRFGILMPLGITGMILGFSGFKRLFPLYLFFFSYLLSLSVSFVSWRYRIPLTLVLFPFTGLTITRIIQLFRSKNIFKASVGIAVCLCLFIVPFIFPMNSKTVRAGLKRAESKMLTCGIEYDLLSRLNDRSSIKEDRTGIWIRLSRIRKKNNDTEGAVRYLNNALKELPDHPIILRELKLYHMPRE